MLEDLELLISFIQDKYIEFNDKWHTSNYYNKLNLKNNLVCDLLKNEEQLNIIFNYREFINENNIQLLIDFKQFNSEKQKVNIRTKTKNSIEYKIRNYMQKAEKGEVPINKCLNDLFGIRIICMEEITNEQIMELVENKFNNLKCYDASKQNYKATHIYFKKDNYNFQ